MIELGTLIVDGTGKHFVNYCVDLSTPAYSEFDHENPENNPFVEIQVVGSVSGVLKTNSVSYSNLAGGHNFNIKLEGADKTGVDLTDGETLTLEIDNGDVGDFPASNCMFDIS